MTAPGSAIAFIGVGGSTIERQSNRSITAFALDAAIAAITDAEIDIADIDGYVGAPIATNPGALHVDGADEISARTIIKGLGLSQLSYAADLHKSFPTDMAISAAHLLLSGECRHVLGVRALYNMRDVAYATGTADRAYGADQFTAPFGAMAAGARFATRARTYLEQAGVGREVLYDIVAHARRHARDNPVAVWRNKDVSLEDYMAAPLIAAPLCRLDCDMPVCGAVAFVMTKGDLIPAAVKPKAAYLTGWAGWQHPHRIFEGSRRRDDIDHCQLYDGFSSMIYEWLEGFGWSEPYRGWQFIRDGHAERDGKLPLNTFGGSLGEGRLHGAGHLRETILQVTGRAGNRQLPRAANGLVHIGPYDMSSFAIISSEP
jgi:acetyl-CoA acetyltransferase